MYKTVLCLTSLIKVQETGFGSEDVLCFRYFYSLRHKEFFWFVPKNINYLTGVCHRSYGNILRTKLGGHLAQLS